MVLDSPGGETPDVGNLVGLILAAGESRRMGTPKVLLQLEGRTFVEVISSRMREAGIRRVMVVVGAGWDRIREQVNRRDAEWVLNEHYERGQLSSLWCGLEEIHDEVGVVMTLVDHPLVKTETYGHLIKEFMKNRQAIIIPTINGRRGHPIVFGAEQIPRFLEAPLDVGARWVLGRQDVRVCEVSVDDPGVRADIDTPEDYGRLTRARGSS
jgi:molybdenum cofactor cytidylyltransferase